MEDKHSFMDKLNLFLLGIVVGCVVGSYFMANYCNSGVQAKIEAYEEYYRSTETLLDSLDGTRGLDLMDTDLATDYGADYLHAKSIVDSLNNR